MTPVDLLAAVLNNPREDAPRLAYAAAVASSDPARAELIFAQVALAQPCDELAPRRRVLRQHAKALAREHGERWHGELPVVPGVTWGDQFVRGFIDLCVVREATTFSTQARAIFAAAPIERLSCQRLPPTGLPELLRTPDLARLQALYLHGGFRHIALIPSGMSDLARRNCLSGLGLGAGSPRRIPCGEPRQAKVEIAVH